MQHVVKLVILGRDGILNLFRSDHVKSPEEWAAVPGALEAVARLEDTVDAQVDAWARAATSSGQSCAFGKRSAAYSMIASESQTVRLPSTRHGTLPVGEKRWKAWALPSGRKGTSTSSKSMPSVRISTHGRSDHEE